MNFEMNDLPHVIARGARAAYSVAGKPDQTYHEWLFEFEKAQDGWAAIEAFSSLAGRALESDECKSLDMRDQMAIRILQACSFSFVAIGADSLINTLVGEGLI